MSQWRVVYSDGQRCFPEANNVMELLNQVESPEDIVRIESMDSDWN